MEQISVIEKKPWGAKFLFSFAAIVIAITGLKLGKIILIPLLFALFLAILSSAPLALLRRLGVPKIIAILMVAFSVIGAVFAIGFLLWTSAHDFIFEFPKYREKIDQLFQSAAQTLSDHGVHSPDLVLGQFLDSRMIADFAGTIIKNFAATLSKFVLVMVILIFMLVEAADLQVKLGRALDGRVKLERLADAGISVRRYLGIKTITCLISGLVVFFWTSLLGLDFSSLWGLLSFVLHYIPYIGTISAAIPAIILGIVQLGPAKAGVLAIGYVVLHHSISDFIEPVLMGRKLGLSPMVVFLSLIFWGWLWGPPGAFLAIPLTMMCKIFLEHSDEFRWMAVLMDSNPKAYLKEK